MNHHSTFCRQFGPVVVAICLLIGIGASATACGQKNPAADSGNETTAVSQSTTLPDLTDERTYTDTAAYASRMDAAFANVAPTSAEQFTYTLSDAGAVITGYTGGEVVVVIPDTIEGQPVVTVAEDAFAGKGSLVALSIPDSVTVIGIGALEGCASLSTLRTPVYTCQTAPYFGALFGASTYEINSAHVPAKLKTLIVTGTGGEVPDYAFYDCPMEAVFLPSGVTAIGDFAFYRCDELRYIPLGGTALTAVGERSFANDTALLTLDLPATVASMGFAMLEGCGKLESLTLPFVGGRRDGASAAAETGEGESLSTAYLGYLFGAADYTFTEGYLPASLIRVTLHAGGKDLPANAFFACSSIREVVLPEGMTAIGRRAFYRCERLASITLPASVTAIGDDAFHGCTRLASVEGGEGLTTLGVQVFMDCLSLRALTLPASVMSLPNAAFSGCVSLATLDAPGVTAVGKRTFHRCESLTGWDTEEN